MILLDSPFCCPRPQQPLLESEVTQFPSDSVWGHVAHGPGPGEVTSALRPGGRAAPGRGRGAWRPRGSGGLAGLRRAERAGGVTCESLFLPCGLQLPRGLKRRRSSAYRDAGTGEDLREEVGAGGRPRTSDGLPEHSPSW